MEVMDEATVVDPEWFRGVALLSPNNFVFMGILKKTRVKLNEPPL